MKRIIELYSYILLLCLLTNGCKGSKVSVSSNQYNYTYSAESFGYNDITKLYSSDTANAKKPFFKSASLQKVELNVKSDISITLLEQSVEGKLFSYQLSNPSLILKSGGIINNSEVIRKELMKPVFVQTDNYGKIGDITLDSSMTEMASGICKDIISRLQFVKPAKKSDSWQTVEENTNGTYTANYHIAVSNSTGNTYEKEFVEYYKYKSKSENQHIDTDNFTTIETDGDGTIKTIHTSEAQIVIYNTDTISAAGTKVSVFLTSKTKIKNSEKEHLLNIKKSTRYSNQTTLSAPVSKEKITKMAYAGTLGSDNWEQLIEKLSSPDNLSKKEVNALILKFRAIFYLQPENCSKALIILEKEPFNSVKSKVLIGALSITETVNATNTLATIIDANKNNEKLLEELLPVLTTTSYPTTKAVNVVKSLAFNTNDSSNDFIKSTAQLTLGGMANKFRLSDSLGANRLTAFLIEKMKTENDTIQHLLVLGNTGSPKVFPIIKSLIEFPHSSVQVKVEAVSALRLITDEQVSVYLKTLLQNKNVAIKNKAKEVWDFQKNNFE